MTEKIEPADPKGFTDPANPKDVKAQTGDAVVESSKDETKDATIDPADAPEGVVEATDIGREVTADEAVDTTPVQVGERRGMFGASENGDTSGYGGLRTPILFPGNAARPYGSYFDEIADTLAARLGDGDTAYGEAVERVVVDRDELTLFVRREHLLAIARVLRDDPALRFEMCLSVSGVHYLHEADAELHAVYHLISLTHNGRRLRLEVTAPDSDPHIPSVVKVWPSADWHERETWDMFGIIFDGHPALTRILMPDDWPGHPQRKDYPLGGIPVEYKGGTVPPPDQRRAYN